MTMIPDKNELLVLFGDHWLAEEEGNAFYQELKCYFLEQELEKLKIIRTETLEVLR